MSEVHLTDRDQLLIREALEEIETTPLPKDPGPIGIPMAITGLIGLVGCMIVGRALGLEGIYAVTVLIGSSAMLGVGVAMLPREFIEEDLQSGRLLHLLPKLASTSGLVHAIFPTRRGMVPAVRHLLDALVAGFEAVNQGR